MNHLLLDTQIFLWLDGDEAKLSSAAKAACSDTGNTLWLSAASAWEMQIKIGLGKLRLRRPLSRNETARGCSESHLEEMRICQ